MIFLLITVFSGVCHSHNIIVNRCRFRIAGIQTSDGGSAIRGLVRRQFAQVALGEL